MSYTFTVDDSLIPLDTLARIAGADTPSTTNLYFSMGMPWSTAGELASKHEVKAKKVIVNNTAVIVLWNDGSKSVAKCHEGDKFDKLMGILVCSLRKASRNRARIDDWEKLLRKICKRVPVGPDGVAGNLRTLADALYLAAGAIEED